MRKNSGVHILDSYKRYDQKNNLVCRPYWDSSLGHLLPLHGQTQLAKIMHSAPGFGLEEFAFAASAQLGACSFGMDINTPNVGIKSWDPLPVSKFFKFPEDRPASADMQIRTRQIKRAARYFGADLVGIAPVDHRWVYSQHYLLETGESKPVEIGPKYKWVIAMAMKEDYSRIQTAPTALYLAETLWTYSRMTLLVASLAQFIRQLGYQAIPSVNDTALNIPIALDAGLGEFGRNGLLITPEFGPRVRLCKVFTDLELEIDKPTKYGFSRFCSVCHKCAVNCPSQAIPFGEPSAQHSSLSTNAGVVKWAVLGEKCWEYRLRNFGTNCGICVRVCPFNKSESRFHSATRFLIRHTRFFDRVLSRIDDLLQYGRFSHPNLFWK